MYKVQLFIDKKAVKTVSLNSTNSADALVESKKYLVFPIDNLVLLNGSDHVIAASNGIEDLLCNWPRAFKDM